MLPAEKSHSAKDILKHLYLEYCCGVLNIYNVPLGIFKLIEVFYSSVSKILLKFLHFSKGAFGTNLY